MSSTLIVHDALHLKTDIGTCQIELCVGDITKLKREDKVDVVVVSAFPGDYSPTPTSLIGQLKIQLGISVRDLSKDKEEDLRRQYFCWWSKPLPDHLSYKRLLCFEGGFGSRASTPPKVIGAVFRCLVPILKNKEGSVIMPLLSSGDQGYSQTLVLRQILKAAVNWMKAGLPLRTLKIVIFSRSVERDISRKTFDSLFQLFAEFKAEVEDKDLVEESEKDEAAVHLYDVYISHCDGDHNTAVQVKNYLEAKDDLKVFHEVQELNDNESWQDSIYKTMVQCSRVITLLSPGYLSSESCIEQYNMALCISRRKHKEVLAPFYIMDVESLPTYMGLMQYIDCRQEDLERLRAAVNTLHSWFQTHSVGTSHHKEQASLTDKAVLAPSNSYEVFISYSHCNEDKALQVLESLRVHNPDLNVFIDTAGLQTGKSWQQSLFHAIDESKVVIALLSQDYFKSKVCKEEYSLAIALHLDSEREFKLVTLLVEEVEEVPVWCSKPLAVNCTMGDCEQIFSSVAKGIVNQLKVHQDDLEKRLAALSEDHASHDEYMQRYRKIQYVMRNNLPGSPVVQQEPIPANQDSSINPSSVIALCFAKEDAKAALAIKELLIEGCPSLQISEPRTNATSRLKALDAAEVIIIMLSPAYLNSSELVEELNIALYRHRIGSHQVIYPIQLSPLPSKPTYVHLLPCEFSAMDFSWKLKAGKDEMTNMPQVGQMAKVNDIDASVASCLLDARNMIVKRLKDPVSFPGHLQVIVNSIEVQKTWNEIREKLSKEKGFIHLKLTFGIKVTSEEGLHSTSASNMKSTSLSESKNSDDKKPKVPVEQDETEQEKHNKNELDEKGSLSHHFKEETTIPSPSAVPQEPQSAHQGSYNLQPDEQTHKTKSCAIV